MFFFLSGAASYFHSLLTKLSPNLDFALGSNYHLLYTSFGLPDLNSVAVAAF